MSKNNVYIHINLMYGVKIIQNMIDPDIHKAQGDLGEFIKIIY